MTETGVLGLQGAICTPWLCLCANEASATETISYMISVGCVGTNYESEGFAFITSFCDQIHDPVAPTTSTSFAFPPGTATGT